VDPTHATAASDLESAWSLHELWEKPRRPLEAVSPLAESLGISDSISIGGATRIGQWRHDMGLRNVLDHLLDLAG